MNDTAPRLERRGGTSVNPALGGGSSRPAPLYLSPGLFASPDATRDSEPAFRSHHLDAAAILHATELYRQRSQIREVWKARRFTWAKFWGGLYSLAFGAALAMTVFLMVAPLNAVAFVGWLGGVR